MPPAPPPAPLLERAPTMGALLRTILAASIVAVMGVVFTISFAVIIYGGSGAPGLSRGIGLSLAGAAVMALVGVWRLGARDTVVQPQDVTAIILSLGVATIARDWQGSPDALLATVVALAGVTTGLTGLAAWLAGRFRLGFLVRFIPYPLIGGFLAATGYLIVAGAIGMTLHASIDVWHLGPLLDPANLARWLPWILAGAALTTLTRFSRNEMLLPACILALLAGFYLLLFATGGSIASARADGLLLGPFPDSFLADLDPASLGDIAWDRIAAQLPLMLAASGMAIVGTLLNASALEIASGRDIDPDRELRGVGVANLAAAPLGGLIGYQVVSETLFARAIGVRGALPGLVIGALSVATLLLGAGLLGLLPLGAFAAILAFLGFDLLDTWLRVGRRLPARDFAILLLIVATAATVGFLTALGVGLLAAVALFVIAYSNVDVVRMRTSAAHLRSRVERPDHELRHLAERGDQAQVYRLSGYLFFGTASRLVSELRRDPAAAPGDGPDAGPRFDILDLRRVTGIDASAAFAFGKLWRNSTASNTELIFCGASPALQADLARAGFATGDAGPRVFDQLDDALHHVEDRLLADAPVSGAETSGLMEELVRLHPGFDPAGHFPVTTAAAGDEVLTQGAAPDGMILLVSGLLRAEYLPAEGAPIIVATIRPGTLVGEIGLYAGVPRTARVVAEAPCQLLRLTIPALDALATSAPAVAIDLHRLAAANLARRLMRTTALLRDADV